MSPSHHMPAGVAPASHVTANAAPWHLLVLVALAEFPDGATIAQLTRPLADGTRDYDSVYRCIYRALRACESSGHVRRAAHVHKRMPFAWGDDPILRAGHLQPPIFWQVTADGADYLATWRAQANQARRQGES